MNSSWFILLFLLISITIAVSVFGLWYFSLYPGQIRPQLEVIEPYMGDLNPNKLKMTVVQAFDDTYGKKIGYDTSKVNKHWAKKNGFGYKLYQKQVPNEKPHFMEYRAVLEAFEEDPGIEYALFIDGDAVVNLESKQQIPFNSGKDIVFGNESYILSRFMKKDPHNSGVMLVHNTPFSHNFLYNVIHNPLCSECRDASSTKCWDQNCNDMLIKQVYGTKNFAVARIQDTKANKNRLIIHPCGRKRSKKPLYDYLHRMIQKNDLK